ncbi:hypothetical protein [Alloalcanivorax profundimaris]|uniref:hypothetical protein n=1 Tax=Alloalcanivorax profundimaris TaxID=2735259 RepID=UPI001890DC26|nr:hypothetical protein [Alloalcanivorax profundimaris]
MKIHRPDGLFELFHKTEASSGRVILTRKIGRGLRKSQIPAPLVKLLLGKVYGLKDVTFSSVRFTGQPLLLNLEDIPCITVSLPKEGNLDHYLAMSRMDREGIPLPSACVDDTRNLHFLWATTSPFTLNEFYVASLIKGAIIEALREMRPNISGYNISNQIPLTGTINSATGQYVGAPSIRTPYAKEYLQDKLLNLTSAQKFKTWEESAGRLLELRALFDERWWKISTQPESHQDWMIFFGASLVPFCTPNQLFLELSALAESLEGKPWSKIKSKHQTLINAISETGTKDYIYIDGNYFSLQRGEWNEWIKGRLEITSREIEELNLRQIGIGDRTSPYIHGINKTWLAIGSNDDFVPEHAFFLKAAS